MKENTKEFIQNVNDIPVYKVSKYVRKKENGS